MPRRRKRRSKLRSDRKPLSEWSEQEIKDLVAKAETLTGDAKLDFVELAGVSRGTLDRWKLALKKGEPLPLRTNVPVKRFTQAQRLAILKEWAGSGAYGCDVAERHGVHPGTLSRWRSRFAGELAADDWATAQSKAGQAADRQQTEMAWAQVEATLPPRRRHDLDEVPQPPPFDGLLQAVLDAVNQLAGGHADQALRSVLDLASRLVRLKETAQAAAPRPGFSARKK